MQHHERALNRLCKWRTLLTGRILGTRTDVDPQAQGIRDLYDKLLILRVEVTALTRCLTDRGIVGLQRFLDAIAEEADALNELYEKHFPGFRATDLGLEIYDAQRAAETTRGWLP